MRFLAKKPHLDAGGFAFARLYAQLSTARSNGMGLGPIDIRAIWQWEDRNGIRDPFVRRHLEDVLSAIDAKTMRRANKGSTTTTKDVADNDGKGRRKDPKSPAPPRRRRIKR